ncbi:hypothetical protein BIW11_07657 [Tropilaelaps mercedesae]|uniref:Uncharacterized protein n=1 Tax=Tropilaelaps mercedesae TaxID=418985 RepID=A0A1V9XT34_9ACAR|nr:hypothetical protein BIW11_07657 [Tropilaelaps mercedesae]
MTAPRILATIILIFSSFDTYVTAWKACILPDGIRDPNKHMTSDMLKSLDCSELDTAGVVATLANHDSVLVQGAVAPKDLSPLAVVQLQDDVFLVSHKSPTSRRRRRRRNVLAKPSLETEQPKREHDVFVVSTFALNPTLLRNYSRSPRYSVFAKLTEGVLQEYYAKYGDKKKLNTQDANSQIYTEGLFNKMIGNMGRLHNSDAAKPKYLHGKSFDEILKEFESQSLDEGRTGETRSTDEEETKSSKSPLYSLWPKAKLHDNSDELTAQWDASTSGIRLVNDSHFLVTDRDNIERIISSTDLYRRMTPRVILVPKVILEEGTFADEAGIRGYRILALFTPRHPVERGHHGEQRETTSVLGGRALRQASLVLANLNGRSSPYPMT